MVVIARARRGAVGKTQLGHRAQKLQTDPNDAVHVLHGGRCDQYYANDHAWWIFIQVTY